MAQELPKSAKFLPVPVCLEGKSVYIDILGNIVLKTPYNFDIMQSFSSGLARFKENGKYGFIDETGKVAIKPTLDSVAPFSGGFAQIYVNKKSGFIDQAGKVIVKPIYDNVWDFSDGYARVGVENGKDELGLPKYKVGFINRAGQVVLGKTKDNRAGTFDDADNFSDGLAPVNIGDRWGFVNDKDQIIIKPLFEQAKSFSEGLAPATTDGELWGYIDSTGRFVIQPQFSEAEAFSEGLAAVSTTKSEIFNMNTGFIDRSGLVTVKPPSPFLFGGKFYNGVTSFVGTRTSKNIPVGYIIDTNGKTVFSADNTVFMTLENGVSAANSNGQTSYIDKTGKFIWDAKEKNKQFPSGCSELKWKGQLK